MKFLNELECCQFKPQHKREGGGRICIKVLFLYDGGGSTEKLSAGLSRSELKNWHLGFYNQFLKFLGIR